MVQDEKDRLLELFNDQRKWCQGIDAADERGGAVRYDAADAVSWDLVGGLCHLFGTKRASRLSETIARAVARTRIKHRTFGGESRDAEIVAMVALLDFNDAEETTYEVFMGRLRALPVWQGRRAARPEAAAE